MENFYNYNFCFNYLQDEVKYLTVLSAHKNAPTV